MEFQYLPESSSRTNRQDNHSTSDNSTNNTFQQQIQLPHHQNNLYQYQFDISHFNQTPSVDPSTSSPSLASTTVSSSSSFVQQQQAPTTNTLQNNISSLSSYQYNFPTNSNACNYSTQNNPSKGNHHLNYQQNQQHQQQHQQQQNQQHQQHQQQNQQNPQQQQNQQQHSSQNYQHHHHQNQLQQYQHQQEEQAGLNFITSSNSTNRHNTFPNKITMNKSRQSRETGIQNNNERSQQQQQQQQSLVTNCTPQVPQYRIFKRGDTIPGIPTPQISLPSSSMNIQNNDIHDGTNSTNTQHHQQQQMHQAQLQQQHLQQQSQQQQLQQPPRDLNCENVSTNVNNLNNINNLQASMDIQNNDGMTLNNTSTEQTTTSTLISNVAEPNSNSEQDKQTNNEKGGSNHRTPISIIGDIARFHGLTPEYRLTNETGPPHCPIFTIVLSLGNEQYQAQGNSIKKSQLAAAQMAVEKTKLSRPPARAQTKRNHNSDPKRTNWTIMQLNTLAEELNEKLSFTSQPVPIMNPYGRNDPPSLVAVHVGEKVFTGEGRNFNEAKNQAAMGALKALLVLKQEREIAKLKENGISLSDADIDTEGKSPISVCHEMALKRGLSISFEVKGEEGPPHLKLFTVGCYVGDLTTIGTGSTKQNAKKATCELMIQKLKEVPPKLPKITTGISIKAMQKGLLKPKVSRKKPTTPVVKEVDKQIVSPISRLLQIAHVKKFREPEFSLVVKTPNDEQIEQQPVGKKGGHRHSRKKKPLFTMEVKIGPHICTGIGPNKKAAKKAAANAALVLLGYAPTESKEVSSNGSATSNNTINNKTNGSSPQSSTTNTTAEVNESTNNNKNLSEVKAYRQLVPGVIVIKGQNNSGSAPTTNMAQEMIKLNSMPPQTATSKSLDGIGKLSYLAELLSVSVSYSDFPKKNEFLSVVSLTTNPPHVAHGTGQTREEAQNSAALEILDELANTGLENVTTTT